MKWAALITWIVTAGGGFVQPAWPAGGVFDGRLELLVLGDTGGRSCSLNSAAAPIP